HGPRRGAHARGPGRAGAVQSGAGGGQGEGGAGAVKLAYMAATPEVRSMPLAWVGDLDAILPQVAEIGYEGIEFQIRDPAQIDRARLERQLRQAGLECTAISTGQVGGEDGLYLVHPDEDVRRRAVERFAAVLDFAAELGVD